MNKKARKLVFTIQRYLEPVIAWFPTLFFWQNRRVRFSLLFIVAALIVSQFATLLDPFFIQHTYALGNADSLLPEKNDLMAKKLTFDKSQGAFSFKTGGDTAAGSANSSIGKVSAIAYPDATKGVAVTDGMNNVDFKLTPKFKLNEGKKDGNRIVYPLTNGSGWAVYTMQGAGVKEDILLNYAPSDKVTYEYELGLGDGLQARVEPDGSIGVYGNKIFSGNVSTGTAKDAELLQKARKNAPKDTHLFSIPAPVIKENVNQHSNVVARYELKGTSLKMNVSNLKSGNYPLSIDPSIFVVTASQFMYGNNETNINFDVDNKLIKKGRTTGARFDSWQNTTNLPIGSWGGGSVASGGYIYQVGGSSFSGQVYSTQGADSFQVPGGVNSITVKTWGGGGGAGSGGTNSAGGAGGGAGSVEATIATTPGEFLSVYVGGGGNPGTKGTISGGGSGGGYTSIYRGGTPLVIAAGGGGGGGGNTTSGHTGGQGGPGGCSSSGTACNGVTGSSSGGGGGGGATTAAAGAAGTGTCPGLVGTSLNGGNGGIRQNFIGIQSCTTGNGAAGGLATGGDGAWAAALNNPNAGGGGGGGAGNFGGGGGGGATTGGGGGGGGGSSRTAGNCTGADVCTGGTAAVPGNNSDPYRGNAGNGGTCSGNNCTGTVGNTGLIVISYSGSGSPATSSLNWAKFDTGNGTVVNANPGSGACSGWCTTSSYNLPNPRSNHATVAYNGYVYVIGGNDTSGPVTSHVANTIYVAKLGANGEPRLWHPTNANPSSWNYWNATTTITAGGRINTAAVAYNNHMYLLGGIKDSSGLSVVNTVEIADILPNGMLGSWSSSTALSANTYGLDAQVYNDRLYYIGGASTIGGAPVATVKYTQINSDGSLNGWNTTTSLSTARMNGGGTMSVVWGGYMYVSGGCNTVNGSGYCTNILSDTIAASINADGSLGSWSTIPNVSNQRMGFGMLAWRDNIYEVGGCSAQNTTSGDCLSGIQAGIDYGHLQQDGEVSATFAHTTTGTLPCNGGTPTNCNTTVVTYLGASIIANGFIYTVGGCTNNGCTTTASGVTFMQLSSNGDIVRHTTCPTGSTAQNGWCVMNTTLAAGRAGGTLTVFGNILYLVGGFNGNVGLANNIDRATLNNDGTLSAWTNQSLTASGATSVSYTYATTRANPSGLPTNSGNLYIFGGCTTNGTGPGCSTFTADVFKCDIAAAGSIVASSCTKTNQAQLATARGMMGGTVFGNYVYLIGGSTAANNETNTTQYAKIDNSNNIATSPGWTTATGTLATSRRLATAFGYNGYIYVVGGYGNSTFLSDVNYAKINTDTGDVGSFSISTITISLARWGLASAVANGRAYLLGGCTAGAPFTSCSTRVDRVERFQLYNSENGAPASWAGTAITYTTARYHAASAILNGYIYVAGGCVATTGITGCDTVTNTVQYAPIDPSSGALTGVSWSSAANFTTGRAGGKLLAAGGTLYYIGGHTAGLAATIGDIYYGTPSSGNVASWTMAGNLLPGGATRSFFGAAVWDDRMYVVGGLTTTGGTGCTSGACNTVFVSPKQSAGGNIATAWSSSSPNFNVQRYGLTVVAYANNLYLLGGTDASPTYLSDTQYAKIDSSTGDVGSWSYSTSLPSGYSYGTGFAANGYIYLMGGIRTGNLFPSTTLVAPIVANQPSTNDPNGIGQWYDTTQLPVASQYTTPRYGASAAYSQGKVYMLGGINGSGLSATQAIQSTLLAQPQIAKYSISFDTDNDVYPSHWLLNGLDNSIGARWQLKYRSASDPSAGAGPGTNCSASAMTNWGQETSFGDVTLQLPGAYTAKDGSGTNMNCARYFYFNTTVDVTKTFGFPEDVSRGPTITDLTLRFSSQPAQRLMHGRTFIGGIQMPDDTPYYPY